MLIPLLGAVLLYNLVASPDWKYIDALPSWLQIGSITAGVLSLRIIPFSYFLWSDEFGIRSLHRWRYTGQVVVSDVRRGNFVATCAGTWDK
jgi:hypothetical protein